MIWAIMILGIGLVTAGAFDWCQRAERDDPW